MLKTILWIIGFCEMGYNIFTDVVGIVSLRGGIMQFIAEWTVADKVSVFDALAEYVEDNPSGAWHGIVEDYHIGLYDQWRFNYTLNLNLDPDTYILHLQVALAEAYIIGSSENSYSLDNKFAQAYFATLSILRNRDLERPPLYEVILLIEKLRDKQVQTTNPENEQSLNILYKAINNFVENQDKHALKQAIATVAKHYFIKTTLKTPEVPSTKNVPKIKMVNEHIKKKMTALFTEINFAYDEIPWELVIEPSRRKDLQKLIDGVKAHRPKEFLMDKLGKENYMIDSGLLQKKQLDVLVKFLNKHENTIGHYEILQEGNIYRVRLHINVLVKAHEIAKAERYGILDIKPAKTATEVKQEQGGALVEVLDIGTEVVNVGLAISDVVAGELDIPEMKVDIDIGDADLAMIESSLVIINFLINARKEMDPLLVAKFVTDMSHHGLEIATKLTGDTITAALHHVPLGTLLYAVRVAVDEARFAQTWKTGREALLDARVELGRNIDTIMYLDQAIQAIIKQQIEHFIKANNQEKVIELRQLSHTLRKQSEEEIKNLLKHSAQINAQQQIASTNRHLQRLIIGITAGLGLGSIAAPPLMIAAAVTGISSGLFMKAKGEKWIKEAVERVQGLAQFDANAMISADHAKWKEAIQKVNDLDEIKLRFQPKAIPPFQENKSINQILGDTVSYDLQLPHIILFNQLTSECTDSDLENQVLAFLKCCNDLAAHLESLFERDGRLHIPEIRNISEIESVMRVWYDNLEKRIENRIATYQNAGKPVQQLESYLHDISRDNGHYLKRLKLYNQRCDLSEYDAAHLDAEYYKNMSIALKVEISTLSQFIANHLNGKNKIILDSDELLTSLEQRLNHFFSELEDVRNQIGDDDYFKEQVGQLLEDFMRLSGLINNVNLLAIRSLADTSDGRPLLPLIVAPGLDRPLKQDEILLPIHIYRGGEVAVFREVTHEQILSELKFLAPQGNGPVRLYLAPTSQLQKLPSSSNKVEIDEYLRGIERSVENIQFYVSKIPQHIHLANANELLDFYLQQLKLFKRFEARPQSTIFDAKTMLGKILTLINECRQLLPVEEKEIPSVKSE